VARRVRNSSGQQMRDCTLSRGVGSASGLNRFTESMKGLGVDRWWHEEDWEWFAVSFRLLPYYSPVHHKPHLAITVVYYKLSNLIIFELIRTWSDIGCDYSRHPVSRVIDYSDTIFTDRVRCLLLHPPQSRILDLCSREIVQHLEPSLLTISSISLYLSYKSNVNLKLHFLLKCILQLKLQGRQSTRSHN